MEHWPVYRVCARSINMKFTLWTGIKKNPILKCFTIYFEIHWALMFLFRSEWTLTNWCVAEAEKKDRQLCKNLTWWTRFDLINFGCTNYTGNKIGRVRNQAWVYIFMAWPHLTFVSLKYAQWFRKIEREWNSGFSYDTDNTFGANGF